MFERLMLHGAALARRAAHERAGSIAAELREEAPGGIRISEEEEGVALTGRALRRRFALDPQLRWLISGRRR
ncbi:MAG TPA: hypothetical protein VFR28_01695 [Allosphingosinicella sp.]|jgi:hypothetical protein|nr:hypothetical protein [Allosphingosinicella sp.]